MTVIYATFSEFTAVYSIEFVSEAEINSSWLPYGALRVNESLGRCFTTPFSSNNQSAKDLSIRFAYLGYLLDTRNETDSEELDKNLTTRVTDICCGNAPMILDDGTSIFPDLTAGSGTDAWSNTQQYKSTFDMRDAEDQRIDPDLIQDTWNMDV